MSNSSDHNDGNSHKKNQFDSYMQFIQAFEKLSPYALDHFTGLFFDIYQKAKESSDIPIKQSTFDRILIATMKEAHIRIKELELQQMRSSQSLNASLPKSDN